MDLCPVLQVALVGLGVGRAVLLGAPRGTAGGAADQVIAGFAIRLGLLVVGTAGLDWFQGILVGFDLGSRRRVRFVV